MTQIRFSIKGCSIVGPCGPMVTASPSTCLLKDRRLRHPPGHCRDTRAGAESARSPSPSVCAALGPIEFAVSVSACWPEAAGGVRIVGSGQVLLSTGSGPRHTGRLPGPGCPVRPSVCPLQPRQTEEKDIDFLSLTSRLIYPKGVCSGASIRSSQ